MTVERGGFDVIRVSDDGRGIHPDDLMLAMDRHATSKLTKREDLAAIHTMGFRGEALASIGVVSELTLQSRQEGMEAAELHMRHGRKGTVEPSGRGRGTTVTVSGLFANVPARLAFSEGHRPNTPASWTLSSRTPSHTQKSDSVSNSTVAWPLTCPEPTTMRTVCTTSSAKRQGTC